jgi:hypothetical protein
MSSFANCSSIPVALPFKDLLDVPPGEPVPNLIKVLDEESDEVCSLTDSSQIESV